MLLYFFPKILKITAPIYASNAMFFNTFVLISCAHCALKLLDLLLLSFQMIFSFLLEFYKTLYRLRIPFEYLLSLEGSKH